MTDARIGARVALLLAVVGVAAGAAWFLAGDDVAGPKSEVVRLTEPEDAPAMVLAATPAEETARAVPLVVEERDVSPAEDEVASSVARRTVSGVVLRAAGRTYLEDVTVRAEWTPPHLKGKTFVGITITGIVIHKVSDATGRFALDVPVSVRILTAVLREREQVVELPPGEEDVTDLEVLFDSGFVVEGQVLGQGGVPVPSARVGAADMRWTDESADAGGRFVLRDVAPEAGATAVRLWATAPWHERGGADVLVPPHVSIPTRVEIHLAGAGALEGRVTDSAGQPVAEATVRLPVHSTGGHGSLVTAPLSDRSDSIGHYRIEGVPPGRWLVVVEAEEYATSSLPDVIVAAGETTRLHLVLDEGATIEGRLLDAAGAPIHAGWVVLEAISTWPAGELSGTHITGNNPRTHLVSTWDATGAAITRYMVVDDVVDTDREGRYRFTRVSWGAKRILGIASFVGHNSPRRDFAPVRRDLVVAPHDETVQVDLVLPLGLHLRGAVVDGAGQPIAGARVDVQRAVDLVLQLEGAAKTDADGRFDVFGLGPGELTLLVEADGFAGHESSVQAGGGDLSIVLRRSPRLVGRVADLRDGRAIPRFTLVVGRPGGWLSQTIEDAEGRFEASVWDDQEFEVRVSAGGYQECTLRGIVPSRTETLPLVVELQPAD